MSLPFGNSQPLPNSKTIVIIDDDPRLQEELTAALAEQGYLVKNAYDGETGLQLLPKANADLVVLDLILPKKDGLKILQALKKDPQTRDMPVIVLSNLENSDNIELAIRLGAAAYLLKSNYTIAGIVEKIKNKLEAREGRRPAD